MKRCYFGCVEGENTGISVIEKNIKEAKKELFRLLRDDFGLWYWTDMRVRWQKGARIDDLPIGHAFLSEEEIQDGVERGAYGFFEEGTCRQCGEMGFIYGVEQPPYAVCEICHDELPKSDALPIDPISKDGED